MPSRTFLNLPEKKRNKLIFAAMEEFSNNSFIDVSINKIINNASIPRGSFYMYFEDKGDLFEYLLDSYMLKLKCIVDKVLLEKNGDLRETFILLYDEMLLRAKKIKYKVFLKNAFVFLDLNRDRFFAKEHSLFEEIKKHINTNNIRSEDLEFIFIVLTNNLMISIGDLLHTGEEKIEKEKYLRKLDMICYGFYK